MDKFNFKKHQSFQKSRKMIIRFLIYGVVIFILLYLIMNKNDSTPQNEEIDQVEIDTTRFIQQ